jgi:hypothetical protein
VSSKDGGFGRQDAYVWRRPVSRIAVLDVHSSTERSGSATGRTEMNAIEDNLCQEQKPSSLHPVVLN